MQASRRWLVDRRLAAIAPRLANVCGQRTQALEWNRAPASPPVRLPRPFHFNPKAKNPAAEKPRTNYRPQPLTRSPNRRRIPVRGEPRRDQPCFR